uniref:putative clathrin assembly protein At1g25240 n=1 Tax=Erigeron canadensis TaxID=72917 RepID=UPI001CB8E1C1|nr:putative clathrin assembly protein At1g25240 [Erigeron canadensis]
MRLWKKVSGTLKDKTSLCKTRLGRRSTFQNPDIEKAVIKATSHDESYIDFRHTQCVFSWIRVSDHYLSPVLWAVSNRLEKTHNWVVALKGLMLIHGIFCCNVPVVQTIGRLPFDLSNFKHGYSGSAKRWSFEAFIRAYYGFLEQKSMFLLHYSKQLFKDQNKSKRSVILQDLVCLQNIQHLLDILLKIKPRYAAKSNMLVLVAMDCLVVESFDIYRYICNGITSILDRIDSGRITEAKIMLSILEKATAQGEKVTQYLDFCRNMGVISASECPKIRHISLIDIQDLENFIKFVEEEPKHVIMEKTSMTEPHESDDPRSGLKTIITEEWVVFEEDDKKPYQELPFISLDFPMETRMHNTNPFLDQCHTYELPDLITF